MTKFLGVTLGIAIAIMIYAILVAISGGFIYFFWNEFLASLFENRLISYKEAIGISILAAIVGDLIRGAISVEKKK